MGLDMYLYKINNKALGYKDTDLWDLDKRNPELYKKLKPYMVKTEYGHFDTLFYDVGYWRKANQIHNWFVENVQGGNDDCGTYVVPISQLKDLLSVCKAVKCSIELVDGNVVNGQTLKDGKWVDIVEKGKVIKNTTVAEELLPTCSGFFFGGTNYDQWYAEDIDDTIEILEKVLSETDFDKYTILYSSSW